MNFQLKAGNDLLLLNAEVAEKKTIIQSVTKQFVLVV
jgi:hypothetical protein